MASPTSRASFASTDNGKKKGKQGPGPAAYNLPPTLGGQDPTRMRGPSYSMSPRYWDNSLEGPGPANYSPNHVVRITNKGPDCPPAYTMTGRSKIPADKPVKTVSPGPIYKTDARESPRYKKAPSYSMGSRLDKEARDVSPGPNSYTLPSVMGNKVPHQRGSPAASMHGRIDINSFAYDHIKGPGPARCGNFDPSLTRPRGPAFSIQGRTAPVASKTVTPGPGAYSPENVYTHMRTGPRYSIGVRHGEAALPFMTLADIAD